MCPARGNFELQAGATPASCAVDPMKYPHLVLTLARAVLITAAVLAFTPLPARAQTPRGADVAASLPVASSFEKVSVDGASSYVLKLKNTSGSAIKLSVTIVPSVSFHGTAKSTTLPARVVEAGDTWALEDLHARDKVSVAASGYATLDLVVP